LIQPKLKIFSDFDGTLTVYDTWIEIGEYFIKDKQTWAGVINDFEQQKIGARECFLKECSLIENFNLDKFNDIIDKQEIDAKFIEFYEFCKTKELPLFILSEGMDYYLERILTRHNLKIPSYSNRFVLHGDKKSFHLEFPYADSDCIKCGTSKRNLLMNLTGEDEISVYIGDGFSDACVVNYADIVFAKKSLASYCWKNNITYFDWNDFGDVRKKIERILDTKKLKHRQTAKLKRRDVYLRG
jgi:2,3-diketo-5-methylthio-1-phosphopentane phosphatase